MVSDCGWNLQASKTDGAEYLTNIPVGKAYVYDVGPAFPFTSYFKVMIVLQKVAKQ